ncbi:hypothetical protein HNP84_002720 [Thermocatellispora tengchongensis]|uniref:Uncharacterized protein n=1 Tax=Thermocatellispora tengchongensis TaxID=1073253 RepID=A0A840P1Y4_9ACTN|nr:hypothetical protein [Thermocatellispora tengchongensis]
MDLDRTPAARIGGPAVEAHPELGHDPDGRRVRGLRDADDAVEAAVAEAEAHRGAGGLGGQPATPEGTAQTPADLDGGEDLGEEGGDAQAGEAGELAGLADFHGEQGEALLVPQFAQPLDGGTGVFLVHRRAVADVPHDLGVAVDGGHGGDVLLAPPAQEKPRGLDGDHRHILPHARAGRAGPARRKRDRGVIRITAVRPSP